MRARSSYRTSSACASPEIGFADLRCVHTHLRGEELTRDDLTDLALLRLDLMAAIDVDERTGLPGVVRSAHLLPSIPSEAGTNGNSKHFAFLDPAVASQLDVDFLGLIEALESEMARNRRTSRKAAGADSVILVNVSTSPRDDAEDSMAELRELAQSAGLVVLGRNDSKTIHDRSAHSAGQGQARRTADWRHAGWR